MSAPGRRPAGITALVIFFLAGAAVALTSSVSLLFPDSLLEPMWRLNPRARAAFADWGAWAVVLMVTVSVACAASAVGLWRGRRWGHRLALGLLLVNLGGDALNAALGIEPRAVVGIPIVGAIIVYLMTRRVRRFFARREGIPMVSRRKATCLLLLLSLPVVPARADERLPIIDMHLHALAADSEGPPPVGICSPMEPMPTWDPSRPYGDLFMTMVKNPPCKDPLWSARTDEELMAGTIEIMKRRNIFGVLSGTPDRVAAWMKAAPGRFFPGFGLQIGRDPATPESLRALHAEGRLAVLAEVSNQYAGIGPDDERMEPFWALAEGLDIPVGIHIGTGPPGVIYMGAPGYRARLHSALTLEEVLVRHPRLRVYIMHAGFPMLDDLLAVLYAHPQVYVDVGVIVFTQPRAAFYRYLRGIVEAGFGRRVMFGSDQMVWPGAIERSIAVIEEAPFLSRQDRRDILYDNAARFLRLGEKEIARHHRR